MFDIAYENEATIEAATIEKEKTWNKILETDKKENAFVLAFELSRYIYFIEFYSIMYGTHGV